MQHAQSAARTDAPFETRDADPNDRVAIVDKFMNGFEEFKSTVDQRLVEIEKKGVPDPTTTSKLEKIEAFLSKDEERNQRVTQAETKAADAQRQAVELKTQLDALQLKMQRPGAGGHAALLDRAESKSRFNTWGRGVYDTYNLGAANISDEARAAFAEIAAEYKALNISNDTDGGYLAPSETAMEILKTVTEISPVRALARLRTTANKSVKIPRRTGQFAARRTGERDVRTETTGLKYGLIEVMAPEMYAIIDISNDMLEDAAFDMQAEIMGEATEQFAKLEGQEFVSGTGINSLEGILVNADVGFVKTGSAASVADASGQADGVLSAFYAIKSAYSANGVWTLNRRTIGKLRVLKDSQNRYIWTPGIATNQPNTIDGAAYVETPDMPDVAAGTYPIAFGDFKRAYSVVDRVAMSLLRDPYSQADEGAVRFRFRRRTGGQVTQAEAIVKVLVGA